MQSLFLPQWQAFLRYHDLPGDAPVHVYLSGLGGSAWPSYTHIIREPGLAKARAILVDMLGHGFSDRPDTFDYTLESHATTIAMLLDHLAITNCVVIAHSMGGSVAIMLAVLRPELVTRLVVAEGNLDPGGGAFSRGVAAQSEEAFVANGYTTLLEQVYAEGRSGDAVAATIVGMLQLAAPHALHRSAVGLVRGTQPTMREHFLKLPMPRSYLFGERSLPDPDTERLPAEGIPVLIVPDAAHGMLWDNPAGFASVLKHALTL
jgi:pimeloyl-ACP methyl ester carboxylesterase